MSEGKRQEGQRACGSSAQDPSLCRMGVPMSVQGLMGWSSRAEDWAVEERVGTIVEES